MRRLAEALVRQSGKSKYRRRRARNRRGERERRQAAVGHERLKLREQARRNPARGSEVLWLLIERGDFLLQLGRQ